MLAKVVLLLSVVAYGDRSLSDACNTHGSKMMRPSTSVPFEVMLRALRVGRPGASSTTCMIRRGKGTVRKGKDEMPLNVPRNRWVLSSIVVSVALATFLSGAVLAVGRDKAMYVRGTLSAIKGHCWNDAEDSRGAKRKGDHVPGRSYRVANTSHRRSVRVDPELDEELAFQVTSDAAVCRSGFQQTCSVRQSSGARMRLLCLAGPGHASWLSSADPHCPP